MTENTVLIINRTFDAPQARVFAAWMEREEWQRWIGPEGVHSDVPLLEPRVGGRYKIIMHLPDGRDFVTVGEIKAYDPPRMFSMSWGAEGAEDFSLLTISLRDVGGKTELTLRHEGFPDAAMRDLHHGGWSTALNKLGAYVTRPA